MKRKLALILTCVMTLSAMAGCKSSDSGHSNAGGSSAQSASAEKDSSAKSGGITLSLYMNADDLAKSYIQKIIDLYEKETGNKIDQQGLETSNAEAIALTKFTTGDIPDIYVHFGNTGLKNFNPKENFVDWSDAEWVEDLTTGSLSQATYDDRIVGLPFWEASNSGCFYNKTLLEELGLEIPATQAEFDALCDKLLEKGIQPIYLAGGDTWPVLYQFALDPVMEEHPDYIEKLNAGEMTYADIPEFTAMCEWFKSSADKGYFGKTFASDSWDYCSEVLGTGEAAMIFVWDTWFDTDYDNESYDYTKEDFGMMPMFMGTCEEGTYEGGNLNLFLVNKNSERVETAKEFIAFMANPDNYNLAFDGISTSSVFKGQTTNVTSTMYQENKENVDTLLRASIANPKIIGFSQNEGAKALIQLMSGDMIIEECIAYIDADRIATLESFSE